MRRDFCVSLFMLDYINRRIGIRTSGLSMVNWLRMCWNCSLVSLITTLCLSGFLASCDRPDEIFDIDTLAQEINQSVLCPVCPGESIDQSQHPLAVQMRHLVVEKLEQGWTGDQIRSHFVDGYGPSVLLDPPRSGINLAVWIVPPIVGVVTIILFFLVLRSMVGNRRDGEGPTGLDHEERAVYFAQIEAVQTIGDPADTDNGSECMRRSETLT